MIRFTKRMVRRAVNAVEFYFERRRQLARYEMIKDHIPDDEFDRSLDMDIDIMAVMTKEEQREYTYNLIRRRNRAHDRSILHG